MSETTGPEGANKSQRSFKPSSFRISQLSRSLRYLGFGIETNQVEAGIFLRSEEILSSNIVSSLGLVEGFPSDAHHKGSSYVTEFVSCGNKRLSVYHVYFHSIQLA